MFIIHKLMIGHSTMYICMVHMITNKYHQISMRLKLKSLNCLWSNILIILTLLIDTCIENGPLAEVNIRSDGKELLVNNMVTHQTVQIDDWGLI